MEDSLDEITEFFGSNLALAPDPDTARVADHLAHHVLRLAGRRVRVLLPLPADGPLGDVVRPHVGGHAGGGLAEGGVESADWSGGPDLRVLEPLPVVGVLL